MHVATMAPLQPSTRLAGFSLLAGYEGSVWKSPRRVESRGVSRQLAQVAFAVRHALQPDELAAPPRQAA
jgi:hypothetical protein